MKRILNYAINGRGTGHVVRLLAINQALRTMAKSRGVGIEQIFLTSSEAPQLISKENFVAYKIASKSTAELFDWTSESANIVGRQASLALIKAFQPDLLITDTFPGGSFQELPEAYGFVARTALIYRPMKSSFAAQSFIQNNFSFYDKILVPDFCSFEDLAIPDAHHERVSFVGPVLSRDLLGTPTRQSSRRLLGIPNSHLAIYLSCGGGGDRNAADDLRFIVETLQTQQAITLVIGAGPLYRGSVLYGPNIRWLHDAVAAEVFPGMDLAISACGYNSFNELMHFGVPTAFFAQDRQADDQRARGRAAAEAGAAIFLLDIRDVAAIHNTLFTLRDPDQRTALAAKAKALVPHNYSATFAEILLKMLDH